MPDRRPVDNLSAEELERVIRERRSEARLARWLGIATVRRVQANAPWWSRLLQLIELAVVVAGLVVGLNLWRTLSQSNADLRAARVWAAPTPIATPIIRPAILPASHQPLPIPEGGDASTSDIPEGLRPLVTPNPLPVLTFTTATPEPQMAVRITISAIGVDFPVVHGVEWEQLRRGVGHAPDTGLPGQSGNVVLAGHNDVFGEPFRDLNLLQPGDEVIVYTVAQQFRYRVTGTRIVPPTEVSVMDPTSNLVVTLISCWPYLLDTERIIVTAELEG